MLVKVSSEVGNGVVENSSVDVINSSLDVVVDEDLKVVLVTA